MLLHCVLVPFRVNCTVATVLRRPDSGQAWFVPRPEHRRMGSCRPCAATNKVTDAGWEGIAGSVGVGILWAALACRYFVSPVIPSIRGHIILLQL